MNNLAGITLSNVQPANVNIKDEISLTPVELLNKFSGIEANDMQLLNRVFLVPDDIII